MATIPRHSVNDNVVLYNYPAKVSGNSGCFANRCSSDVLAGKPDFTAKAVINVIGDKTTFTLSNITCMVPTSYIDTTGKGSFSDYDFIKCWLKFGGFTDASRQITCQIADYENMVATVNGVADICSDFITVTGQSHHIEIFCGNFVGYNFTESFEGIEFVKCPYIGGECLRICSYSQNSLITTQHTCNYTNGITTTAQYTHTITQHGKLVTIEWPALLLGAPLGNIYSTDPLPAKYRPLNGAILLVPGANNVPGLLQIGSDGIIKFIGLQLGLCSTSYHVQ